MNPTLALFYSSNRRAGLSPVKAILEARLTLLRLDSHRPYQLFVR